MHRAGPSSPHRPGPMLISSGQARLGPGANQLEFGTNLHQHLDSGSIFHFSNTDRQGVLGMKQDQSESCEQINNHEILVRGQAFGQATVDNILGLIWTWIQEQCLTFSNILDIKYDYSKRCIQMFTKFVGGVGLGKWTNQLHFGTNKDPGSCIFSIFRIVRWTLLTFYGQSASGI